MAQKKIAPCSGQADTARDVSFADATNTRNIAQVEHGSQSDSARYLVTLSRGELFRITVCGRRLPSALEQLRRVGEKGCTPIDNPAPRWSAYIFKLRALGLDIETNTEPHGGGFPGHHARFVLRCRVTPEVEEVRQ